MEVYMDLGFYQQTRMRDHAIKNEKE